MTIDAPIAGLPPLRMLATGSRSQVWLVAGEGVLKRLEPGASVLREAEALHRGRGPHVIELLDAAVDDEGAALLFPRMGRGSLAELMARRAGLDAGEIVTVLAPVAETVARLHAAGVAHGALSADHILFRDDGAPVLAGFGAAQLFDPGLPEVGLEAVDGVRADRAALCALAVSLLTRVTGRRSAAAAELAGVVGSRAAAHELGDLEQTLVRDLFELAAARPVSFAADDRAADTPSRVVAPGSPPPPQRPAPEPGLLGRVLERGPARLVRAELSRRWQRVPALRRRLVLGAAAAVVVLGAGVLAVPSPGSSPGSSTDARPVRGGGTEDEAPGAAGPAADTTDTSPQVAGDDPLAALPTLLSRRTDCFRELSQLCLGDVDEPGSSALEADRVALAALQSQARQPVIISAEGAGIVERWGDSVIVALAPHSEPASLLLLKGEAGWRIRDYIAAPGD